MTRIEIRRALVSVYDKAGLGALAGGLHEAGVEIVSTGSTAAQIGALGVPVTPVSTVTGFPEMLDGRVKTLHPYVHAGLLADRGNPDHVRQLAEQHIEPFELVIANLYPFRDTVRAGGSVPQVIEQIDIGGPAMVRAAAKNHASVAVVVDPSAYAEVLEAVDRGGFEASDRRRLAAQAFAHTAAYDAAVANWFAQELAADDEWWPAYAGRTFERAAILRYGENPHQRAALYVEPDEPAGIAQADQLHGKPMSYNNYVDADAAHRAAYDFTRPCVAIVKHSNPCGIALGADVAEAHRKALACDPLSAFGGVVAANTAISLAMAEQIAEVFTEVVVAPAYEEDALEVLRCKKNIRLLVCAPRAPSGVENRDVSGGALVQTVDAIDAAGDDPAAWSLAAGPAADADTMRDLSFAWRAVRAVKSNAILLATAEATVGVGMGQVNRVDAAQLAVSRAGGRARGSVAASDAFFPFADGLHVLLAAGVRAVVQPGGSVRDGEAIAAATSAGVPMYLTGTRHFFH